jgi:hypothetical protein
MPSAGGIRTSLIDYALGAGGGLLYALSVGLLGSGLIGGLIGAVLAGSMIKGERGTAIATILGFMTIAGGLSGGSASATTTNQRAVM